MYSLDFYNCDFFHDKKLMRFDAFLANEHEILNMIALLQLELELETACKPFEWINMVIWDADIPLISYDIKPTLQHY